MNLVESIARGTSFLEKHGVTSARLNAETLLGHLLGLKRVELYTNFERALPEREAQSYRLLLVRRARGYPLQYETGEAGFRRLVLEVRPGVFIPRPETEILVENTLEVLPEGAVDVLDIGTGCGNIACSIALEHPGASVTAIDRDWLSLEQCRRNAARNGMGESIEILEGDLYGALGARPGKRFDAIVSNPPYVSVGSWEDLPDEVKYWEPFGALFAGEDGLDVAREIVAGAPARLKAGGWLLLELDERHIDEVADDLLSEWREVRVVEDLAGRRRVVRAQLDNEAALTGSEGVRPVQGGS